MYSPVCWPGRMPGMNAPPFYRFSAVSRELNTIAVSKKQKKMIRPP
jgi:hypothetical protein